MKLSSNTLKIVVLSGLILIFSCGKKKTGLPGPYGPGYPGPGYGNYFNNLPAATAANVSAYLGQYPCPNGRAPEITFSVTQSYQGSGNTTQIQGNMQQAPIGGIPSNTYIGVNFGTKDVIVINKMSSGAGVVGFNVSLSLCRDIRQVNSGYGVVNIPIIDQSRMPVIYGSSPIIISDPTNCAVGTVDQATVILNIPAYLVPGSNVRYEASQLPVSFTRANCMSPTNPTPNCPYPNGPNYPNYNPNCAVRY